MEPILKSSGVPEGRPWCPLCRTARTGCYCARLRPLAPRTEIVLLQHPLERRNAIGTARMTHRGLAGSRLVEGIAFDAHSEIMALLSDSSRESWVLFPGPDSVDIAQAGSAYPPPERLRVFVIDGTWAGARAMLRKSPRMAALPRLSFPVCAPSDYRVRRQPAPHCLSTIEATHRLLRLLEPALEVDALLTPFRDLVERQSAYSDPTRRRP